MCPIDRLASIISTKRGGGVDIRSFERSGDNPRVGIVGQDAAAFYAEQPVQPFGNVDAGRAERGAAGRFLAAVAGRRLRDDVDAPLGVDGDAVGRRQGDRTACDPAPDGRRRSVSNPLADKLQVAALGVTFLAIGGLHRQQSIACQRDVKIATGMADGAAAHIGGDALLRMAKRARRSRLCRRSQSDCASAISARKPGVCALARLLAIAVCRAIAPRIAVRLV